MDDGAGQWNNDDNDEAIMSCRKQFVDSGCRSSVALPPKDHFYFALRADSLKLGP